jgi:transposase-like protein
VLLELTVAEQRFNAVMEVLRDGLTVVEVADRYGVSRQAIHGWLRRYRTGGLDALADRSHRPKGCPHQMPAAVEARLCELRRHHPGWGQRRLAHELARDGVDPPPGLTSIYRALARYGTPAELLTDNGKVFTGRLGPHPAEVLFDRICREHGITHRCTGIRCPTTTGKIERFHKTLRAELLTGRRFASLAQAQQVLDAWVADYNTQRPHQAIAMAVPARRFQPPTAATTPVSAAPSRQPLIISPTEITRRVAASGLIGVCYQQVSAGRHLAGQVVTVRVHPRTLQVFFAGQLIRTVPRRSTKEVVQLRAHQPHQPKRPTTT